MRFTLFTSQLLLILAVSVVSTWVITSVVKLENSSHLFGLSLTLSFFASLYFFRDSRSGLISGFGSLIMLTGPVPNLTRASFSDFIYALFGLAILGFGTTAIIQFNII